MTGRIVGIAVTLAVIVVYILNRMNIVTDLAFWLVILGAVVLAVIDYYWLGGILNGRNRSYDKK